MGKLFSIRFDIDFKIFSELLISHLFDRNLNFKYDIRIYVTHNLDPVILNLGFIDIRWYSLAYIFGILFGGGMGKNNLRKVSIRWRKI